MSVYAGIVLPKVIHEVESKYNGKISVIQAGKTKKLSVGGVIQSVNWDSPAAKKMYWGALIEILKKETPNMSNILIFGLGGGCIQHLISREFPNVKIVSVEIDSAIVDIAKEHFGVGDIPNHRIITEDACRVVISPKDYDLELADFDVLLVDIYCGETYPDLGDSGNFMTRALRFVGGDGLVIFNRIYLKHHQDDANDFAALVELYLKDVKTDVIAGKTNSDNLLIYGRV